MMICKSHATKRSAILFSTLLACMQMLQSAPVAAATIHEQVTVKPAKTLTLPEESAISSAGSKVLRHIAQARADIYANDVESAKTELGKTEKLLSIIQTSLPTSEIKDRIWVAKKHLEYEDTQQVIPDLIPIYTSLDELVDFMPIDSAKDRLDQAKQHLQSGDKEQAKKSLEETDAALHYTEIDLPLATTRQLVAQADAYLNENKLDAAEKSLKAAEDGVVFLTLGIEQPLFTAKNLLWQATAHYKAGDKSMAKADLQAAIDYLKVAEKSDQASYSREAARELLLQAQALQNDFTASTDVEKRLRHVWQRAQAFADRSLEYITSGWARYRADNPMKSDLIEAKLHLSNAKIDRFTGNEFALAEKELDASEQYLNKAIDQSKQVTADVTSTKQLLAMKQDINVLIKNVDTAKEKQFVAIEKQLQDMIRIL